MRLRLTIVAIVVGAALPIEAAAQDSALACPAVDSAVRGSIQPHSYLLGHYDAVADTTHLEGGGTDPRVHVDLRVDFQGSGPTAPRLGILDVLLGDPYVEAARTAPDTTKLAILIDDSLKVRTFASGRMYRRMDPYPITLQGALNPLGIGLVLGATKAAVVYGADTVPVRPEILEGFRRLTVALACAPKGIPRSR